MAQVDVIKRPQFVEELVEGTLPLNNGVTPTPGPITFTTMGWTSQLGEEIAIESDKLRMLGSYDVEKQLKLGYTVTSSIVTKPFDFKLAGYGMKVPIPPTVTPPDPTGVARNGTAGVSISILMSARIDGVEKYKIFTGVKFNGCEATVSREGGCTFTMPFEAQDVTDWTTEPVWTNGAPTYAPNPTATTPFTGISGGIDPLTINGVAYDTSEFSFNVDLGLNKYTPNGKETFKFRKSMQRNTTVDFNTLVKNNVLVGDLRAYTPRDVAYKFLSAGPKSITFHGVQFEGYNRPMDSTSTDFGIEEFSGMTSGGITINDP